MREHRVPLRTLVTGVVLGMVTGSALTVAGLSLSGVRLQRNLTTPAFSKFFSAYDDLTRSYYFPISQQALLDGAIKGMTEALNDPFTDYFSPSAAKQFQNYLSNSFDGIGVTLKQSGTDYIIASVTPNSPAHQAGLQAQDVILKVAGKPLSGLDINQVSGLILGKAGTNVQLTIQRPGDSNRRIEFTLTREKITVPTVLSKMLAPHLGYMAISVIGAHTADEVMHGLSKLKQQGATRLIVDLRGNGGGYLEQAELIAYQFVPAGKVIVQTQSQGQPAQSIISKGPGMKIPMVVLMDKNTASAAEVLAAALHDDNGIPLVGTTSYGKGTVQQTQMYPDGSGLKYTVARWLTPTGFWVQHKGLTPTVSVALPTFMNLRPLTQAKFPLQASQNDTDVIDLQKVLQALGYKVDRNDGYFDESTVLAVKKFQTTVQLPATGMVDWTTAERLQVALNKLIENSDTQLREAEHMVQQESQ